MSDAVSASGPTPEPIPVPSGEVLEQLTEVFKLLSDRTRLRILIMLFRQGEMHVRALCDELGQSQPAVSHHLALLRGQHLIQPRREGKHNFYSIRRRRFQELLATLFETVPQADGEFSFEGFVFRQGDVEEASSTDVDD